MMRERQVAAALVILAAFAGPLPAQQADGAERALANAKALLRQLQQDNDELSASNRELSRRSASLERELESVSAERTELARDLKTTRGRAERLEEALVVAQRRRDEAYERIRELTEKLKEHIEVLKRVAAERDVAEVEGAECSARFERCEFKNARLFQANQELVELYGQKDSFDRILQREPFTRLKQVEIESILEEYRHKLSESRVKPEP